MALELSSRSPKLSGYRYLVGKIFKIIWKGFSVVLLCFNEYNMSWSHAKAREISLILICNQIACSKKGFFHSNQLIIILFILFVLAEEQHIAPTALHITQVHPTHSAHQPQSRHTKRTIKEQDKVKR